jgi:NDP-sugar pyrophosphorylase family protein
VLIECVQEDEPLGTFGGLKNSTKKLFDRVNYSPNPRKVPQRIFVFNSDIICDFPLDQMIQKFEETSCLGVMALTKVDNP